MSLLLTNGCVHSGTWRGRRPTQSKSYLTSYATGTLSVLFVLFSFFVRSSLLLYLLSVLWACLARMVCLSHPISLPAPISLRSGILSLLGLIPLLSLILSPSSLDLSLLVITKALSRKTEDYAAKQAHVELAERYLFDPESEREREREREREKMQRERVCVCR